MEIEVECPKCGRDIDVLSGYAHLGAVFWTGQEGDSEFVNGYVSEIALGRDWDSRKIRLELRPRQSAYIENGNAAHETQKWSLKCRGRRCGFSRLVACRRVSDAMIAAWRKGSHRVVAGIDL